MKIAHINSTEYTQDDDWKDGPTPAGLLKNRPNPCHDLGYSMDFISHRMYTDLPLNHIKVKGMFNSSWEHISELRGIICHTRSH